MKRGKKSEKILFHNCIEKNKSDDDTDKLFVLEYTRAFLK